ncbi:ribosomal protein S18-alanine N-acetyltransferase [Vagococcus sp. BWB3-3]|uniref:[Ribosomal protein bS18]-alanine N-acetyltransferase n=1 Tax=Vagococcus allomyrinae TaxID=2794353 RepID=A0A940PED9_9ENTE|nr:ribosomal protein S18-alanine N-acetyltransferase [Vagococcus allomyrinae]MBP1043285.1 ribosomal protein S18-alanine N-acetyltransferase [Vagococcus allomyrinae]
MIKHKEEYGKEELAQRLWQISQASFDYGSPWNVDQFLADINNPVSHYVLVEKVEKVIGYVVFHQVLDEAEVINIAVLPEFKGKKVAQELLEYGLKEIGENVQQVFLEVRETNDSAKGLYLKVGFEEIGRRKAYYHHPEEDGLVMRWQTN